jgi:hypothetical protein
MNVVIESFVGVKNFGSSQINDKKNMILEQGWLMTKQR